MEETAGLVTSPKILLGSGRSGTTWIQDCLADSNELRPIFEPLHPFESKLGSRCSYEVLTRTSQDEELELLFGDPDSSVVAKRWTAYRAPRGLIYPKLSRLTDKEFSKRCLRGWRKYIASIKKNKHKLKRQGLLFKCIRANLMVDWLANRMNYTVAMIIRHPCAVVESKYRLGAALRRIMAMTALMGAESVLVGLRPGVVSALIEAGADVDGLRTAINLDTAFGLFEPQHEPDSETEPATEADSGLEDDLLLEAEPTPDTDR